MFCHMSYLPLLRYSLIQWIFRIRRSQESLYTQQYCSDLQGGTPVVLEDVETNTTQAIDVGVVDSCEEAYLRRAHRVVVWKEELELEDAAWNSSVSLCLERPECVSERQNCPPS